LTQIAVAYVQGADKFIADKVFPPVPVQHQADKYFIFSKDDYYRDEAQVRADATESAGGGFNLSTGAYSASVWAFHKDVGDQVRRNADPAVDIDIATTEFVMQRMLIRRDRFFMSTYMVTGQWSQDVVGTAGGTPGSATPAFWNDDAGSDPFTDISTWQTFILQNTGYEANILVLGYPVYQALRKHPLIIDRLKYTEATLSGTITPQLLAQAFDVDEVLVSKAVYNTAAEGATGSYSFVMGKNALLCYRAPSPGLMVPSAGYIFPWEGYTGTNTMGIAIKQIPMPWLGSNTIRTEGEMSFDMQITGKDLGVFFSSIVQ